MPFLWSPSIATNSLFAGITAPWASLGIGIALADWGIMRLLFGCKAAMPANAPPAAPIGDTLSPVFSASSCNSLSLFIESWTAVVMAFTTFDIDVSVVVARLSILSSVLLSGVSVSVSRSEIASAALPVLLSMLSISAFILSVDFASVPVNPCSPAFFSSSSIDMPRSFVTSSVVIRLRRYNSKAPT